MEKKKIKRRTPAANDDKYVKREITYDRSVYDALMERKKETGIAVTEQVRKALVRDLNADESKPRPYIPLLGIIPAGGLDEVKRETPGTYISPPFDDLKPGDYALKVCGHSMEAELGMSIEDGAFIILRPGVIFPGAYVHVEFSNGQFEHTVTFKKYIELDNGQVEFRPLNKSFKTIRAKKGEFEIRGGMVKKWDGISED